MCAFEHENVVYLKEFFVTEKVYFVVNELYGVHILYLSLEWKVVNFLMRLCAAQPLLSILLLLL